MHTPTNQHRRIGYLDLSIESLWIARVIHDALDIALDDQQQAGLVEASRLKALRLNRDVFERLGIYGCSADRINPWSTEWSAASRVELIRQVGVHWREFINASFGTAVSLKLIQALTDDEVQLLEQIQKFGRTLQLNSTAILHDMQLEMAALSHRQETLRAMRCASYLRAAGFKN